MTIYPTGDARPTASTVNWEGAGAVANNANVIVHPAHSVTIYNLKGTVNVVIDLLGYYAPSPAGGSPGPAGPTGPAGPAGPAGASVYIYAGNTAATLLAADDEVTFDAAGPSLGGIAFTESTSNFTVPSAGVYKVTFAVASEDPSQFAILVGGSEPASGPLVFGGNAAETNVGTAVLPLLANSVVTVSNVTGQAVQLNGLARGTSLNEMTAWIVIEKLNG